MATVVQVKWHSSFTCKLARTTTTVTWLKLTRCMMMTETQLQVTRFNLQFNIYCTYNPAYRTVLASHYTHTQKRLPLDNSVNMVKKRNKHACQQFHFFQKGAKYFALIEKKGRK